jgi:hypothetical protein
VVSDAQACLNYSGKNNNKKRVKIMDDNRNENQKNAAARAKQKQLDAATKAHNRQKDINEKNAISENEKAVREAKKTERELNSKLKNVAKAIDTNQIQGTRARQVISNFKNRKGIDAAFNSKISKLFDKKKIAVQKETTARMNITNVQAKKKGKNSLNSLKTTLRHMLRMKGYKRQTEEWIEEHSHLNLYFHEDKYYTHEEFLEIQDEVYDSIIKDKTKDINNRGDKRNKEDVKKYSNNRSSYRNKVIKIAGDDEKLVELIKKLDKGDAKELNSDHEVIAKYLKTARKRIVDIVNAEDMPDGRRLQKIKLFDTWVKNRDIHNNKKAYERVCQTERENVVSEVSFKIPHNNKNLGISQREYLDSVKSFFEKSPFLKNHKVLAGCVHFDESKQKGLSEDEITGANVHLITDCKSSENNRYQWRKSMIDFARSQQDELNKQFGMDFKIKPKGYDLSEKEICHAFQLLQLSFYKHIQLDLFLKKSIKLKFVAEEDRNNSTYILACLEQELAIQDRISSRFNMQHEEFTKEQQKLDDIKKEMEVHKANLKAANKKLEDTEKNLNEANKEIERLAQQLTDQQEKEKELKKSIGNKTEKKKELSSEILAMVGDKDQLSTDIKNLENKALEQALNKVDKWMHDIQNGNDTSGFTALTASAAAKAIDKLAEEQPEIAKQVTKTAVKFEEKQEKAIEEHLKVSNKVKSNIEYNEDDLKQIEENQSKCIHNKDPEKCKTCSAKGGSGSKFKI